MHELRSYYGYQTLQSKYKQLILDFQKLLGNLCTVMLMFKLFYILITLG